MRPSAQPIRPLPGYLNHLQELFLQAAKLLEPDHRARVEAAISGVDHARVERAMEQILGLSLAAEAACPVYETEVVKPLIAAPESHDEVFRRLFALRDTFDTSETAEIDAFECGELEIPYAIRTRSEALAFARSEVVGALLAGTSPLIQHYHPKERSLVVSSPVVAVLAARFALGLEALAQGALLIGLARRVELLGIDLDGDPWFAKSYERVPAATQQMLSHSLARLLVERPATQAVVAPYPGLASALTAYLAARDEQVEGVSRRRIADMHPERLRGLLLRARRSESRKLGVEVLLRDERIGSAAIFGQAWRERFLRGGAHAPDIVFRNNEHPILRLIADLIGRRDMNLAETGSPAMEKLVDGHLRGAWETLRRLQADLGPRPYPGKRGWDSLLDDASSGWPSKFVWIKPPKPVDPDAAARAAKLRQEVLDHLAKMLDLVSEEATLERLRDDVASVQTRLGLKATAEEAEALLAQEAEAKEAATESAPAPTEQETPVSATPQDRPLEGESGPSSPDGEA
jgi:hypothetical protein